MYTNTICPTSIHNLSSSSTPMQNDGIKITFKQTIRKNADSSFLQVLCWLFKLAAKQVDIWFKLALNLKWFLQKCIYTAQLLFPIIKALTKVFCAFAGITIREQFKEI